MSNVAIMINWSSFLRCHSHLYVIYHRVLLYVYIYMFIYIIYIYVTFRHEELATNTPHNRSMIYHMHYCRWRTETMSGVATSMAPKNIVNMAHTPAVTMATTATTVLIMAVTITETITAITNMGIQVTSMAAIIDLLECTRNTIICSILLCRINISERTALLLSLSNNGHASDKSSFDSVSYDIVYNKEMIK